MVLTLIYMVSSISCDCRCSLLILLYIGHICDDRLALRVPALEASKHENEMEDEIENIVVTAALPEQKRNQYININSSKEVDVETSKTKQLLPSITQHASFVAIVVVASVDLGERNEDEDAMQPGKEAKNDNENI